MSFRLEVSQENGHARLRLYSQYAHDLLMQEELPVRSATLRTIIRVFWHEKVDVQETEKGLIKGIMQG